MRKLSLLIIAAIAILSYSICYGESPISVNLELSGTYVDNVFQTPLPEPDYVSLTDLNLSYNTNSSASIFYNVNLSLFSKHPDLRSHNHYLGAEYEKGFSRSNATLNFGGWVGLRQNTLDYNPYDLCNTEAQVELKYYLTKTILTKAGYGIGYESYPNYQTFSFLKNYGFAQLSKFFQTKTTLQLRLDAGWRNHPNITINQGYARQVTGSAKIAQSLADSTGLQLQYSWHFAPDSVGYEPYMDTGYYSVEDFFEDEYDYSSHKYQMTLKHLGPRSTIFEGTLTGENREYNIPFITVVNQDRKDNVTNFYAKVEKEFSTPLGILSGFSLNVEFLYRNNKSSDPYYDYSTKIISISTKSAF